MIYCTNMRNFRNGVEFKIKRSHSIFRYIPSTKNWSLGHISNNFSHECNISYIGETIVKGYTFVMGKKVTIKFDVRNDLEFKSAQDENGDWHFVSDLNKRNKKYGKTYNDVKVPIREVKNI